MQSQRDKNTKEVELENRLISLFEEVGWTVRTDVSDEPDFLADLSLLLEGKLFAIVEIINNDRPELFLKKIESIRPKLETKEIPLLIITDGTLFHVSVFGSKFEASTLVPRPDGYFAVMALIRDYCRAVGAEDF